MPKAAGSNNVTKRSIGISLSKDAIRMLDEISLSEGGVYRSQLVEASVRMYYRHWVSSTCNRSRVLPRAKRAAMTPAQRAAVKSVRKHQKK